MRPKKAVFYVGNLSVDCTAGALKSFVSNMNITDISCFDVRPRHRFAEDVLLNRKGFLLCILDKDRQHLLNESLWPESVTVSEWISKPQRAENVRRVENTQRRSDAAVSGVAEPPPSVVVERAPDAGSVSVVVAVTVPGTVTSGSPDDTILVAADQCTNSTSWPVASGQLWPVFWFNELRFIEPENWPQNSPHLNPVIY